ncbi:GlcG/HbpS family heme-binding protein [Frateuria defendens]|uniref:GlcG/HbpS family heme-binding protein n=1 Tax=Frateuria defendens TaxID=2219559 RepID=UPI00066FBB9B|nr:heme-binding protein [Frateuria defendens]
MHVAETPLLQRALSLAEAERIVARAKREAGRRALALNIVVVDAGAAPLALARMDGTVPVASEMSYAKARTAARFGAATQDLAGAVQPGAPLFGIWAAEAGPAVFIGGGVPVRIGGRVVGAVGVGGATPEQDHEVAAAAAAALETAED